MEIDAVFSLVAPPVLLIVCLSGVPVVELFDGAGMLPSLFGTYFCFLYLLQPTVIVLEATDEAELWFRNGCILCILLIFPDVLVLPPFLRQISIEGSLTSGGGFLVICPEGRVVIQSITYLFCAFLPQSSRFVFLIVQPNLLPVELHVARGLSVGLDGGFVEIVVYIVVSSLASLSDKILTSRLIGGDYL